MEVAKRRSCHLSHLQPKRNWSSSMKVISSNDSYCIVKRTIHFVAIVSAMIILSVVVVVDLLVVVIVVVIVAVCCCCCC